SMYFWTATRTASSLSAVNWIVPTVGSAIIIATLNARVASPTSSTITVCASVNSLPFVSSCCLLVRLTPVVTDGVTTCEWAIQLKDFPCLNNGVHLDLRNILRETRFIWHHRLPLIVNEINLYE